MKVKVHRIDRSLPLPRYETTGAAAFDLCARKDITVKPRQIARIPANLIAEVPRSYVLLIALRSSTPALGLTAPHGVGIIDQDYRGAGDEIKILVYNFGATAVMVKRGQRIAQGLLVPIAKASWVETVSPKKPPRGGFGSTNKKRMNK